MLEDYYSTFCANQIVILFTFLWGFFQDVKINSSTFNNPIKTAVNGIISGSLYSICGTLVCGLLPDKLQGIVSIMCLVSIIVMKIKEILLLFNITNISISITNTQDKDD